MPMFEVSKDGLRKILERRGIEFALFELVQNALDENTTVVNVELTKKPGSRIATIRVEDDNPTGFADLTHAYTLFAESAKKDDPLKRGRFNLGEKLVIAVCEECTIVTTTGAFAFANNERTTLRRRTEKGSVFQGQMRLTNQQFEECCKAMTRLLPPPGVTLRFNGKVIPSRTPLKVVEGISLRTEIADAEGYLRPTTRKTNIHIHNVAPYETGMVYEMGIPVVETGDDFHVDIQQKVPLTIDRDNVPPAYLRDVRTAMLNAVHEHLDIEAANHTWVQDALQDPNVSKEAVQAVITQRFTEKSVAYDPHDPESNKRAVAAGYVVVHGRSLPKEAWENVRKAGALTPAGQVTPSPKPYGDGPPYEILQPNETEFRLIQGIRRIAKVLLGHEIVVHLASSRGINASATYGRGCPLVLNRQYLGHDFFKHGLSERVLDLLIHELGHEDTGDHLNAAYYRALTRLGAKLAHAVKADPTLLELPA